MTRRCASWRALAAIGAVLTLALLNGLVALQHLERWGSGKHSSTRRFAPLKAEDPQWMYAAHDGVTYVRAGWIDELKVQLVGTTWFGLSQFALVGFQTKNVRRSVTARRMVRREFEAQNHVFEEMNSVVDVVMHLDAQSGRNASCTRVPTNTKQNGDNIIEVHICITKETLEPEERVHSEVWRLSRRERKASTPFQTSMVVGVTSFTPHVVELVQHHFNIHVEHIYIGFCGNEQDLQSYTEHLRYYIDAGYVSLLPIGQVSLKEDNTQDFFTISTCRIPVYQLALFHAKLHGDQFLLIADLDEMIIPMLEYSDIRWYMAAAVEQSGIALENICYLRVHSDEVSKAAFDTSHSLSERFQTRCDCSPLPELKSRSRSNVGSSCGVAYMKAIANVQTTFFASVHSHSACTAHHNSLYEKRPADSPPVRPWVHPDLLRIHHYSDMWSSRPYGLCNKVPNAKRVPSEYATRWSKFRRSPTDP